MNKQQFKADMEKLIKYWKSDVKLSDDVYKLFRGEISLWGIDLAVDLMDRIYSPKDCWVSWWMVEANLGAAKMKAGYNGKIKEIKTIDNLIWLIEQEEKI